jgi:hypothetical protein
MSTFEELQQRARNKGYDAMKFGAGHYRFIYPDKGTTTLYSLEELEKEIARHQSYSEIKQMEYKINHPSKSDPAKAEAKRMLNTSMRMPKYFSRGGVFERDGFLVASVYLSSTFFSDGYSIDEGVIAKAKELSRKYIREDYLGGSTGRGGLHPDIDKIEYVETKIQEYDRNGKHFADLMNIYKINARRTYP